MSHFEKKVEQLFLAKPCYLHRHDRQTSEKIDAKKKKTKAVLAYTFLEEKTFVGRIL